MHFLIIALIFTISSIVLAAALGVLARDKGAHPTAWLFLLLLAPLYAYAVTEILS